MIFPSISRIATKKVVTIPVTEKLDSAVEKMAESGHRDIIVVSDRQYYLLVVNDLIRFKLENMDFNLPMTGIELPIVPQIDEGANILDAFKILEQDTEYICLVDEDFDLCGIVTQTDIITSIDPEILMENSRIGDMLKNTYLSTVSGDSPTLEVLDGMINKCCDCSIIMDGKKPVGILTTKDAVEIMAKARPLGAPVKDYMSTPIETLKEEVTVKEALEFLKKRGFKRVVVVNNDNELLGVILQKDLIALTYSRWAELMKNHQNELSELNSILQQRTLKLEKMASTDPLTQLYNRSVFVSMYQKEEARKERDKTPLSLIILDIDYFKGINDDYGHLVGDKVLQKIASILGVNVRSSDLICRWGGEEFLILLPGSGIDATEEVAEKIRKNIEETEFHYVDKITASFGVAEACGGDSMEDVIGKADKALYRAKEEGRNRVMKALI